MRLRTKEEQKAYLDGYEMCAKCIQDYITEEGRVKLDCLLKSVKNAIKIEVVHCSECTFCNNNFCMQYKMEVDEEDGCSNYELIRGYDDGK